MKPLFCVLFAIEFLPCAEANSQDKASLAQVYYWKSKPGKLDDYNKYIQQVAEPIDEEARKTGAFISVTTYISPNDSSQWTHMRVFLLRDSTQLQNLSRALDEAGARIEPDETKRKKRSEYAVGLRDFVRQEVLRILR